MLFNSFIRGQTNIDRYIPNGIYNGYKNDKCFNKFGRVHFLFNFFLIRFLIQKIKYETP